MPIHLLNPNPALNYVICIFSFSSIAVDALVMGSTTQESFILTFLIS
jgi:hypothetical protein